MKIKQHLMAGLIGLAAGVLLTILALFLWIAYGVHVVNVKMDERIAKAERVENEPQLQGPPFGPSFFDYGFLLEDLQGHRVPMSTFRGKVLMINFWSSSCKPCVAEMPRLAALYRRYKDDPAIAILAVTGDSRAVLAEFAKRYRLDLPLYRVADGTVVPLRPMILPTTLIVGVEGKIVVQETGAAQWDHPRVFRFLEQLKGDTTSEK